MARAPLSPSGTHYHLGVPLAPEQADAVRAKARSLGYRSVSAYVRALLKADLDGSVEADKKEDLERAS